MLYKEWLGVRIKFYLWLGVYAVVALLQLTVWSPYQYVPPGHYSPWRAPTFTNWFWSSLVATAFAALLGGLDLVSDEVDKGTLSFLLARSISRKRIYATKILTNCAGWAIAYGLVSAAILTIDHFQEQPIDPLGGVLLWLLGFAPGIGIICLAGLVSVFTRNVQQTLIVTVAIPLGIGAFGSGITSLFFGSDVARWLSEASGRWLNFSWEYLYFTLHLSQDLISGIILGSIATVIIALLSGLFWAGLVSFSRKEF